MVWLTEFPFIQTTLLAKVRHWSGSMPLASASLSKLDPDKDSSWIFCYCFFQEDHAALELQDESLHMPQQVIDEVAIGRGRLIARMWACVVAELVSLPALLLLHPQG